MGWVKPPTGPMRAQLLSIIQSVYNARDLPPPVALDHWWHCPQISYLVNNPDDYAPKTCIINVGEGERGQPAIRTRFMINLDNLRVTDKFSDEKFPAPSDIHSLLTEVRQYAIKHHQKEKGAKERAQNRERARLIAEKKRKEKEIEDFHQKIVQNEIMSDEDLQTELKLTPSEICPVCFDPESSSPPKLWKCLSCRTLLCPNADCDVFKLDNPKRCFHHPGTVYCQSCVGPEDNPRLRPCPSEGCDRWTCHTDWKWCTGRRVVDAVSSTTTESSDERPAKKVKVEPQPAHARRLAPLDLCVLTVVRMAVWNALVNTNGYAMPAVKNSSLRSGPALHARTCFASNAQI
ncbi:hypothetical protein VKT23_012165 [Stygiomarasmius scandens]|uniref:Uncharacterized protein n=1 Tax=Marasmiellus scandens TaxID=2682957 RepID=A0ABR1JC47_9AGAR